MQGMRCLSCATARHEVMSAYTSRCSGLTLEALKRAGWRFIIEPSQNYRTPSPLPYGLDNGAWGCHTKGLPFDVAGFERVLQDHGSNADWIVLPDIVGGGLKSLEMSESWLPRLEPIGRPMLLPVQDGMVADDVRSMVSGRVGLFLGGSTEWKLKTMSMWGELAREAGCYFHVARVNSVKRIRLCQNAGADSFDGSSPTRFRKTLRGLDLGRRQGHFWNKQTTQKEGGLKDV